MVPHNGIIKNITRTHISYDYYTCINTNSCPKFRFTFLFPFFPQFDEFFLHFYGCFTGHECMIIIGNRDTKFCHNCITFVFINNSVMSEHRIGHFCKIFVEKFNQFGRSQSLGERGKSGNICEHNGNLTFLTTKG